MSKSFIPLIDMNPVQFPQYRFHLSLKKTIISSEAVSLQMK